MNQLLTFQNHTVEVLHLNGEALFNPYNVGDCLDIDKVTIRRHIQSMSDKQVIKITNSIVHDLNFRKIHNTGENFLTKSGVYKLIFKSHKPDAERFQDWVTDEVLPQIEKTGGYIPVSNSDDDATILIKAVGIYERTIKEKDHLISNLLPKAQTYDMIMDSDGTFSLNQVAKFVGMGEYNLFQFLRQQRILFYEGTDNVPYERFRKNKCFKVVMTKDYRGQAHSTTKVYPKGVDYICKIISKSERMVG